MWNWLIRIYRKIKFEYRIGAVYLVIGSVWIFLSDKFFGRLINDKDFLTQISIIKGFLYVLITTLLLFFMVKRHLRRLKQTESLLKLRSSELAQQNYEFRTLNKELIISKKRAEESDELKTAFLQNMSHEIRTPMNAIVGFSGFLKRQQLSPEKRNNYVEIIEDSVQQLLSIVDDILTVSLLEKNQEALNLQTIKLNGVIKNILSLFKVNAARKNISLIAHTALDNERDEIYTDSTKLTQILSNLLTNAIKFTQEGSVEFGYKFRKNEIEFYVKDTGIGIEPSMQEKIFDRFSQAGKHIQQHYGGTGLGLSISKGFVELLGGKIRVESELGKGACFYFTIPLNFAELKNTDHVAQNHWPTFENKIVLIVEDEEYNYLLLKDMLKEIGILPLRAKNGKEVVDICRQNQKIDLIFMDIKMPILDGFEAAKQIKEFRPDIPIVAQTAYSRQNERLFYNQSEFFSYLTKPIDKQILFKVVNQIFNKIE
jgi:signal transduction histidine kinase/CheY-like chemotaxis protein